MIDRFANTVSRLATRVLLAIGRGRVTASNDAGVVQLVQVQLSPLETIDNMPRVAEFGFTSHVPNGTDAVALFIGGDRSKGVIVATNHQSSRPTNLAVGEAMLYSLIGQQVYLSASGIVVEAKGLPVTVNDASNVTVNCSGVFKVVAPGGVEFDTPTVKSSGDIVDNSGTNAHTMAQMRAIYDGHNHPVHGVQIGSSQVTTDPPNQQQ